MDNSDSNSTTYSQVWCTTSINTSDYEDPYERHLKEIGMWCYALGLKAGFRDLYRWLWEIQNHHDHRFMYNNQRFSKLAGIC